MGMTGGGCPPLGPVQESPIRTWWCPISRGFRGGGPVPFSPAHEFCNHCFLLREKSVGAGPSIKQNEAAPPFAIFKGWASVRLASDKGAVVTHSEIKFLKISRGRVLRNNTLSKRRKVWGSLHRGEENKGWATCLTGHGNEFQTCAPSQPTFLFLDRRRHQVRSEVRA